MSLLSSLTLMCLFVVSIDWESILSVLLKREALSGVLVEAAVFLLVCYSYIVRRSCLHIGNHALRERFFLLVASNAGQTAHGGY